MIVAFIVLLVIVILLGGYITYMHVFEKKKALVQNSVADQENVEAPILNSNEEEQQDNLPTPLEDKEEVEDDFTEIQAIEKDGKTSYIVIKYSKSFLAKLIQSDEETKRFYSDIKNELLSYDGVKSRMSWKWETFRIGRKTLAKLRLRGKTLSLCLALDVKTYMESKYIVEDLSQIKSFIDTPCLYRIKNNRRLKYSLELISDLMEKNGVTKKDIAKEDYCLLYPYEDTAALIEKKLIKVLTDEEAQSGTQFKPKEILKQVSVQEVDQLMQDSIAADMIEISNHKSDKTKQGIINIDTLSEYFESEEVVTLDEVKKRIKGFSSKVTYLKVLARGTLDKPLTVEADSFSLQAVKMIVLTGGKVLKRK